MNAPVRIAPELTWPAHVNEVPKEVFYRKDVYQAELERIFYGPEWHVIGHRGEVPNPGDFKLFDLAEVPLLISHGSDGELRVFVNACSHRGNQLETAPCGNKSEFECPYHRWLFTSDGRLAAAPGEEDFAPDFSRERFGLQQVRTAEFCGLIFATLSDETPPIDEWLGEELKPTLAAALGGDGRLRLLGYQKTRYTANWKAYVDNDGYHAPLLHMAFRLLNWQGGKGRQFATGNLRHLAFESQLSLPRKVDLLKDDSILQFKGEDPETGSRVIFVYPITIFTKHLDMINIRFAIPRGVDHTEVHYAYFSHVDDDEEMVHHRIRQSSNLLGPCGLITMEDASIFHRIHIGNHSPGVARFEKGVRQLDSLWTDFKQNDEAGNLPRWEYYRRSMGFRREGE